ncbi:MAG: hypothetical protein CVV06_06730 [Gammaproteobacteria bacterium HGW-Gammaproteobacteria-10]|nr:MAG: hypothetical protein CVV06_06730 [Gammaproteobacteria bacterium HGW-Gammaproteobacteria-10]
MTDLTFTPADYPEIRHRMMDLNSKIFRKFTKDDIKTCGKHLGIWHQKTLMVQNETEMDLFTDYAMFAYRPHGFNMAEKFLRLFSKEADAYELELLRRMSQAPYAIYQVEETNGTDSLKVVDVFSKVIYRLVDHQLARTARQGMILAGHLIDFDGFSIQTGGTVLLSKEILVAEQVTRIIDRIDDNELSHFLSKPANGAKMAKAIISATIGLGETSNFGNVPV